MNWKIDWSLDEKDFRKNVDAYIMACRKDNIIISIPLAAPSGEDFIGTLSLLLSKINCEGCPAHCCRSNGDSPIYLTRSEYSRLSAAYGTDKVSIDGLMTPCFFLKSNRCSIYKERPMVCLMYPFEPQSNDEHGRPLMGMNSCCPEASRLARRCFMISWQLRHKLSSLSSEIIDDANKMLLNNVMKK